MNTVLIVLLIACFGSTLGQPTNQCICLTGYNSTLVNVKAGDKPFSGTQAALDRCLGPNFIKTVGVVTTNNTNAARTNLATFYPRPFKNQSSTYIVTGVEFSKQAGYERLIRAAGANPNCTIIFDDLSARKPAASAAGVKAFVKVSDRVGLTGRYVSEGEGLVSMDCSCFRAAEGTAPAPEGMNP